MRNPPGPGSKVGEGTSRRPPETGNAETRVGHMEKLGRVVQKGKSLCKDSEASHSMAIWPHSRLLRGGRAEEGSRGQGKMAGRRRSEGGER